MAEELKQTASGAPGEGQLSTGVDFEERIFFIAWSLRRNVASSGSFVNTA